jgi:hypothetical protein
MSVSNPAGTAMDLSTFFPLYDMLHKQVSMLPERDAPIPDEEIRALLTKISQMDKNGKDMIYIWIRIHSLRNSNSKLLDIPYGGAKLDTKIQDNDLVCDVKFDLRNFPPVLNRMLSRFTDLHIRKLQEDASRMKL